MERRLRETLEGGEFSNVSPTRSRMMSAVRGKGNKTTEVRLRLAMVKSGLKGWKVNPRGIIGNPDFLFPVERLALFVDGCFWHGCSKCGHVPKTNNAFWKMKIQRNQERDKEKSRKLRADGFQVLRFWEHDIKADLNKCISLIKKALDTSD